MSKRKSVAVPLETKTNVFPWWIVRMGIVFLVLFFYAQTREFGFTLDDDIFYQKHQSVQEGVVGIGDLFTHGSMEKFDGTTGLQPYRPITLLSFTLERIRFDNDPGSSHMVNVVLYILLLQVLLSVLIRLFSDDSKPWIIGALMIYLLHPMHVEVVASVKSRDELLAALFGFMAWNSYLKSSENNFNNIIQWILSAAFLMLALLSKESAIVFLVILPLSVWQLKGKEIKKLIAPGLPLLLVVISFLWIRHQIVGTVSAGRGIAALDNVLSLAQETSELWATKMEILAKYLQLLFIPWPLSWDYSNAQIPLVGWSDYRAWIGLIVHLGLLGIAIWGFRKWAVISFSILFYLISTSPTNNLFFLNGATVAERFLFVPSFGYALLLGWCVYQLLSRYQPDLKKATNYYRVSIGIIALIYSFIINSRIPDWSSNMRLFESGVKVSPNSSKANQAYATELENRARESQNPAERAAFTEKAMRYFHQSLAIMPGNADAALKLGQIHDMEGRKDSAIVYYQRSIAVKPQYYIALNNLGAIYAARKQFDLALDCFRRSYQADTAQELTLINLMVVHYNKQQKDSVRYFGNKALGLGFGNPKIQELMR